MKPIRVGMISFAHMHGFSYAECIRKLPNAVLAGVADDNIERGQQVAAQLGTTYVQDYETLLRSDVDAVIVCSENVRHKEAVVAAAQAGKHILCEKPIATSMADARAMIDACNQHNVKLQIAFPARYNQPARRVKEIVDQGNLGRLLCMRGTNRGQNPGGWFIEQALSGGGAVLDHTVHILDLMRWITKSEVTEVYAEVGTRFYDIPIDDCGLLMLEFENGVFASHDPSWSFCPSYPTWGDLTLELVGTQGVTQMDGLAQHLQVWSDKDGKMRHEGWGGDSDFGLVADFVRCVQEDTPPSITGEDGLRAMEVALAAYESARTGQPVMLKDLE